MGVPLLLFTGNTYYLLHVESLDPTHVKKFRSVSFMVSEILGIKLKNKNNDENNWRYRFFAIPC